MSDVGSDIYSFTHRTFLEFFYARHLEQGCETVRALLKTLLPHIRRQEWDVVCHLALQIKTFRNQPRTAQAMQALSELIRDIKGTGARELATILFVARSLEYLLGTEKSMSEVVRRILTLALGKAAKERGLAMQCIAACCAVCTERRECVQNVAQQFFRERFVEPENGSDIWVADILSYRSRPRHYYDSQPSHFFAASPEVPDVLSDLINDQAVQKAVRARSSTSAYYALLRWEWYREAKDKEFRQFGFKMFGEDVRLSREKSFGAGVLGAVPEALNPHFKRQDPDRSAEAAALLRMVARCFTAQTPKTVPQHWTSPLPWFPIEMWRACFRWSKADKDLFLGALAMFTLYGVLVTRHQHLMRRFNRSVGDGSSDITATASIKRLFVDFRCDQHPIAMWYREQIAAGTVFGV